MIGCTLSLEVDSFPEDFSQERLNQFYQILMELIEVKPSSVSFIFPQQIRAETTLLNLTLHQVVVRVLCSNPDNFIIDPPLLRIDSFEEAKLVIKIKYYQEALLSNYLGNKIMLYCYDEDQDGQLWNTQGLQPEKLKKIAKVQLQLNCTADMEKYSISQPKTKQLIIKVHRYVGSNPLTANEKHSLITYLETLGDLKCLHSLPDGDFLAQYRSMPQNNISIFYEMAINNSRIAIYSISTVPVIMKEVHLAREKSPEPEIKSPKVQYTFEKEPVKSQQPQQPQIKVSIEEKKEEIQVKKPIQQIKPVLEVQRKAVKFETLTPQLSVTRPRKGHNDLTTTTFIGQNSMMKSTFISGGGRKRRRNKSVEAKKNEYDSEEQDESKYFVDSKIEELLPSEIIKLRQKVKETKVPNGKVLNFIPKLENVQTINCVMDPLSILTTDLDYFVLFNQLVIQYEASDKVTTGKKIMLGNNAIEKHCKEKKLTMKAKDGYLVIACDSVFCVITLETCTVSWVSVQRKEIYDLAVLRSKDLVAIGGKNLSKFSLFGKTTSRSNIKLYKLKDHNEHLLTFDIDNAGVILQLQQITIGGANILLGLSEAEKVQSLYLMNVVAGNKIEVIGRFGLMEDLAIISVRSLCFVGKSDIYGLECLTMENRDSMVMKRFHIKALADWKTSIATQTCPIKQNVYSFFQSDNQSLVLYSCTDQELTVYNTITRTNHVLKLELGFRALRFTAPYVFLLFDTYIQVKKIVL